MTGICSRRRATLVALLNVLFFASSPTAGFVHPLARKTSLSTCLGVAQDIERPGNDDLSALFMEDDDPDEDEERESAPQITKEMSPGRRRWENLNPKIKQRLVEKGQAKAIANKKKREPARDKKRREYRL